MFTSFFSQKHAGKKSIFIFGLFALFCAVSLSSCKTESDDSDTGTIYGTWESAYSEYFVIDENAQTVTNYYGSISSSAECYAGENLVVVPTSDTAGIIYIQYTRSYDSSASNYYSENGTDVGNWYAIAYKSLTSSSVSLSAAYKSDGVTSESTLDEAESEFTIANGYFSSYSECVK